MNIDLFGSTSLAGASFISKARNEIKDYKLNCFSRTSKNCLKLDLKNPKGFLFPSNEEQRIWISFAPIWYFSEFLEWHYLNNKYFLNSIKGLIIHSSSSVITKRFSFNDFDRKLVKRLKESEQNIIDICSTLNIKYYIIRPTMIYGRINNKSDKNIHFLISLMRKYKFIPLPKRSGLRQPIHITQLSSVTLKLFNSLTSVEDKIKSNQIINLGGDSELTYKKMLIKFQHSLDIQDPAKSCKIVDIPNRIFLLFAIILLFKSSKAFEAALRIMIDLSGFTRSCEIINIKPQKFPIS